MIVSTLHFIAFVLHTSAYWLLIRCRVSIWARITFNSIQLFVERNPINIYQKEKEGKNG